MSDAVGLARAGERWEAFYEDGQHIGALYRRSDGAELLTRISFPLGGQEYYCAESRVTFAGAAWQTTRFRREPGGVEATGVRTEHGHGPASLPGYAEYLLLRQLAAAPRRPIEYDQVADEDPAAPARPARLAVRGIQTLEVPDEGAVEANRVEIVAGGRVVSTHWVADGALLGSDWNGARSFPVTSAEEALDGVADPVAQFLRNGPAE